MKELNIYVILILSFFVGKLVFAGSLELITPEQALKLQADSKAVIVDVREVEEINSGKIKNAVILPMSLMEKDRVNWEKKVAELNKEKTIILYCRSGRRADLVGSEFTKKGFKANNLGGFDTWKSKGLPTE